MPSDNIAAANDSKLIHVTGETAAAEPLEDPLFNLSEAALRLRRYIQVFEWKENKESKSRDELGGGKETVTTYTYEKAWVPDLIRTNHRNPEKHNARTRCRA